MAVYDPYLLESTPPAESDLLKRYPAFNKAQQEYHNFSSSSSGQSPEAMAAWQRQSGSLEEAYHEAYASAHRMSYTQRQGSSAATSVPTTGAPVTPVVPPMKGYSVNSNPVRPGRLAKAAAAVSASRTSGPSAPSSGNSFAGLNLNVSGGPTPTLRNMPAYQPPSPGSVGPVRQSTPINNALRNGKQVMSKVPFGRPGLLMTAIGAGTAGAVMGNGDFSSFAMGAGAGLVGGHVAEAASSAVYAGLTSYGRKNAGQMSETAFKAVNMGRMMTAKSGRGMIFGGGALLAGGLFSSMFASNSKSYKQGFNANRGNSIVR
jgi:hypothetical protein